jgi:2-methylcitrate dehydratase
MQTVAELLGAYASSLRYEDIPPQVAHQTRRTLIDTLGCGLGGYDSEPARIACELAALVASSRPATVMGGGHKTSLELAVFANSVMVRYLDFNDGYVKKGSGHPSDCIAALLSVAEVTGASGRDLIVATVIAYEVFCGICDAWDHKPPGIDSVTTSGIAVAAAAARLMGLTQPQITEAINIMVAGNIALYQTRLGNVSMWKGSAAANASRNAVFAAQLAARGMTGPSPIFEGRNGFFKIVSRQDFDFPPLGGGEQLFRILHCHFKQFPLGNYGQPVVTAALEARALVGDVNEIEEVHIRTSQRALNVMADNPEKWRPRNRETADHSMPYTTAVALIYGTIDAGYFEEEYFLHNKELLAMTDRVKCSASEEATRRVSESLLCDIEVLLKSGERRSARVEYHRGHWRNPMSDAEVEAKFRKLAGAQMPTARIAALLAQLWEIDKLRDLGTLMNMMRLTPH